MTKQERGGPLKLPGSFADALGDLLKVKPPPKSTKPKVKGKRRRLKKRS